MEKEKEFIIIVRNLKIPKLLRPDKRKRDERRKFHRSESPKKKKKEIPILPFERHTFHGRIRIYTSAGELYSLAGTGGGSKESAQRGGRNREGISQALFQFKRSVKVTITIPVRANHLFTRCRDAPLIYSRQLIIAE